MPLVRLRDFTGVEALDWEIAQDPPDLSAFPQLKWEGDKLVEKTGRLIDRIDAMSTQLFGINRHDTAFLDDEPFDAVRQMFADEAKNWWASHGWDVTDHNGRQMLIMEFFLEPMISALLQLHPDAKSPVEADLFATWLEEEARNFKPKR